ncbi:putative metalloprotease, contains C-terminal PDZ domain [Fodinibius salinus]|uniref:Putative metalloprotease, contains C-terminal PDZ domain n=1 Tax=Fodinibius salinus TaxID=860790 RepID=A0A5D3YK35_9BACT|nr:PDZ domain-containing protein [Fodinibius salinus]TYP93868.1 putative metalloprotease, contains C-terminal PDZ domain [Fodinibius salinus]
MREILLVTFIFSLGIAGCKSGTDSSPSVQYDVRFSNAEHNEADITLTAKNLLPGPVTVSMSRTSPGRYALHEFAKNVYEVTAVNSTGDTLEIDRPDLHNWTVKGHDGTVKFNYTLYGRHADGTYSGINEEHAHLNMPATFAWIRGLSSTPVTVNFYPPQNSSWDVATQLQKTDDPYTFKAPDYYYFLDSPTELSNFDTASWEASADTSGQTIQMAVHHNGTQQQVNEYADMAQKVVAEQVAVYGMPVDFDFDQYTFIVDYLPYVHSDGMEHRNSTILTSQTALKGDGALQNLYTLSHEFFHSWNVERMRPKSLEPFNFMEANVSGALWFAEGFTSYYDDLTIRRAGIISNEKYAADWAGTLNYVLNSVGNQYYSPIEMSQQAPFVDAATSVDAQNKSNTFISYYSWGATIGLGLDLTLRSTFEDVSLDDYMRAVWKKYGITEKPYTIDDLQQTLAEVTDSTQFAETFFDKHIRSGKQVNLKPLLANAGFVLQKAHANQSVISLGGAKISYEDGKATISENTQVGSPLYSAGLDVGDEIQSIDGQAIDNARDMQQLLAAHDPGSELSITYTSLGESYESMVTLVENPQLQVVPFEQVDKTVTDSINQFREDWLGSKATASQ